MRRLLSACLTIATLSSAALTGAASASSAPDSVSVQLGARTVLSGASTGKVDVALAQPAQLTVPRHGQPGSISATGSGRFVGFALVAAGTSPDRVMITAGRIRTGLGDAIVASSHSVALAGEAPTWLLPAGNYSLYLITDGAPATVAISLDGPSGSTTLTPERAVPSTVAQPPAQYLPQGAQTGGAGARTDGPGLLLQLTATIHPLTFVQNLMHCLYLGQNADTALHAPGCPDADVRLSTQLVNANTDRVLVYGSAAGYRDVGDTVAQGYSLINAGLTESVSVTSVWLTL